MSKRSIASIEIDNVANSYHINYGAPESFEIEIIYFLSWIYRRLGQYEKGRKLLDYAIEVKKYKDPRLFHSRSLCLNSEVENAEYLLSKYLEEKYKLIIQDMETAIQGYLDFANDSQENKVMLVEHIRIGLLNSLSYMHIKLYLLDPNKYKKSLIDARALIDTVRLALDSIEENYENYPSYNHTEVEIEYCESRSAHNSKQPNKAISKINDALARLKLIEQNRFLDDFHLMDATIRKVKKWKDFLDLENRQSFPFDFPSNQ